MFRAEAAALLTRVGNGRTPRSAPIGELAYGDVKRVELAVALAAAPRLLLMDEPTAGMAPRERAALMQLTAGIARQEGIGVLFTEHDMDAVFAHADRILVLVRGEIIAQGSPEEVRADEQVKRVYLGTTGHKAALRARRAAHG
jgi:branched-chain amino acid transport system ATP-binding protein